MKNSLLLLLLIAHNVVFGQYTYKLNLQKGAVYYQTIAANMDMSQVYNGDPMKTTVTVEGSISYEVLEIKEDSYLMRVEYDYMGMTMDNMAMAIDASSDYQGDADIFSRLFRGIIGVPFYLNMHFNGTISDIRDTDKLWEAAFAELDDISFNTKQQLSTQIEASFGGEKIKENFELLTALFPNKEVRPGQSWKVNKTIETANKGTVKSEYTLKELTDEFVIIEGPSTMSLTGQDLNMNYRSEFSGTAFSTIRLDRASGWIVDGSVTQNLEGTVYIQNPYSGKLDVEVPTVNRTSITYSNQQRPLDEE